jgi:hypothetical protein
LNLKWPGKHSKPIRSSNRQLAYPLLLDLRPLNWNMIDTPEK